MPQVDTQRQHEGPNTPGWTGDRIPQGLVSFAYVIQTAGLIWSNSAKSRVTQRLSSQSSVLDIDSAVTRRLRRRGSRDRGVARADLDDDKHGHGTAWSCLQIARRCKCVVWSSTIRGMRTMKVCCPAPMRAEDNNSNCIPHCSKIYRHTTRSSEDLLRF